MRLRAMAKINLGLDVLRKREDGYHEVRMIMQTIQMYDLLDIRKKEEPGISLSTNLPYVPSDERNLVYKAAKLLMDEFDIKESDITLQSELSQDLGINSVELMDLAMRCEEEFDIQFPDDDVHKFNTVGDIVEYIENYKK